MKECVLDEYSTKHRISINRFLQLKIFVKVHDRGCLHVKSGSQFPVLESNSVHGNEISLSCESEVHPWYLRYIMFQPLKESCIHSGDSNFLDLEWLST
uniref:Uncharacterized protein n=3 Tax=Oryza TaxID=4527 RepID=A0A0E0QX01_ORYRU